MLTDCCGNQFARSRLEMFEVLQRCPPGVYLHKQRVYTQSAPIEELEMYEKLCEDLRMVLV